MTSTALAAPDPDDEGGVALPPASERQGNPGHDQALERATAIRLLTLRAQGMTYAQIAAETGYADASGARQALLRALDRHEAENATQLRTLENMRLDADERVLRGIAGRSDVAVSDRVAAINARVRLSARRARLNGLDAPVQVQLSAGVAADLADALAELGEVLPKVQGEVTAVHDEVVTHAEDCDLDEDCSCGVAWDDGTGLDG